VEVTSPSAPDKQDFHDGLWAGRVEAATIAGGVAYYLSTKANGDEEDEEDDDFEDDEAMYSGELSSTRTLMRELETEFEGLDPLVARIQAPASGRYKGASAEDDDGDQDVVTDLTFLKDGRVRGWGRDGVDGYYEINDGRWSCDADTTGGARVAWIEEYEDGFEVALRGQVRKADGAILGMWASSRGVSGSVEAALNEQ